MDGIRKFLNDYEYSDFTDGKHFADEIVKTLEHEYSVGWGSVRAKKAINGVVKNTYDFYRLRDTTPFGNDSPIKVRLGGPDRISVKFIGELDHFYFSRFGGNTNRSLKDFLTERYLTDGAALFGRESSDEMAEFRKVAGDKFKNLTDRQTLTIVQTAVQRIRNWAHIGTLNEAEFEYATLRATIDDRTSMLCLSIDGKRFRVGVAQAAIERLNQLEPADFAEELYGSDLAKSIRQDPSAIVRENLEPDGKTIKDELVESGLGFPPFHPNCRTWVEGEL